MPPSYSPCPRPILKHSSTSPHALRTPHAHDPHAIARDESGQLLSIDPSILSPLVRFPPTPVLTRTFSAYSAAHYDRSPIVVAPNRCALPERGCPGRTYAIGDPAAAAVSPSPADRTARTGRHLHPRLMAPAPFSGGDPDERDDDDDDPTPRATPSAYHHPLPPLIPDVSSSESDESDSFTPGLPDAFTRTGINIPASAPSECGAMLYASPSTPKAMSFLPHSPTRPSRATASQPSHPPEPIAADRPRRRPHSRRRESSRGASRSPPELSELRYKSFSERSALSSALSGPETDCLDGF